MNNFERKRKVGDKAEDKWKLTLCTIGCIYLESNKTKSFDSRWKTPDKNASFICEVKNDVESQNTGHIAIERHSWGKASGLSTTKATHWVHRFYDKNGKPHWFVILVSRLREIILRYESTVRTGGKNTDPGSKPQLYIIPENDLWELNTQEPENCVVLPPEWLEKYEQL